MRRSARKRPARAATRPGAQPQTRPPGNERNKTNV
jgi:hypothetical protein